MKVLFVCSGNFQGKFEHAQVFVHEQMESLRSLGIHCDLFLIVGKGKSGYFRNAIAIRRKTKAADYQLIHAVFGFSGLAAALQRRVPVITSFIGSDIHSNSKLITKLVLFLSCYSIFVENKLVSLSGATKRYSIIPFGIDTQIFKPSNKLLARKQLNYNTDEKIIVFASSFLRPDKNFTLAQKAMQYLDIPFRIIELGKSYTREELALFYNAADLFLMTSLHEGSPQTIKEAMACNCPIVSTDVGDVKEVLGNTDGTYLSSYDPKNVAEKIQLALEFAATKGRTNGRERIIELGLDNQQIAQRIYKVYQEVLGHGDM